MPTTEIRAQRVSISSGQPVFLYDIKLQDGMDMMLSTANSQIRTAPLDDIRGLTVFWRGQDRHQQKTPFPGNRG